MEKDKKDIVQHIVERLKEKQELPYKAGAWENFQTRHLPARRKPKAFYWAASAAAALILGILGVNQWFPDESENHYAVTNQSELKAPAVPDPIPSEENLGAGSPQEDRQRQGSGERETAPATQGMAVTDPSSAAQINRIQPIAGHELISWPVAPASLPFLSVPNTLNERPIESGPRSGLSLREHQITPGDPESHTTLAQGTLAQREVDGQEPDLRNKRFKLMDKFQMGLFVSPNSTNERFNFGGGLLLTYQLSNALSLRTGLAYNKYEVSEMRDPVTSPEMEVKTQLNTSQMLTSDGAVQAKLSNSLVLPNVNAITGNVQALEVPLELKYAFTDGFYASSGMTYAAILQQNRYAHYIQNVNQELFQNGLPENQTDLRNEIKQISGSIKTEDENVRSNQFGGFVNFAIGKEMRLNKGVSLSVEPYLKLPVGSFKRADMNYTNGGIRIITNF